MKTLSVIIILSLSSFCAKAQEDGKTKHALIFAIGDYPEKGGWPQISSLKDVPYVKTALKNQGFEDKNIKIVTNEKASINGIKDAFTEFINSVNKGDIAVVHFSCHGEQVEAEHANKIDGLDECVVTFNAVVPYLSTDFKKDQAEYLRGHVLGSFLKQLRSKLGKDGDVVVFMDFCHSGGGARGAAKVRGGQPPFVSSTYDPSRHRKSDSSFIARENSATRADESALAPYEVISATRPEEVDAETVDENGEGVGSLTYAVSKAFENLEAGTTYRSFFAKVQNIMNGKVPSQHPLLEGNGADRTLFGGTFVHQKPYIEIFKIVNDKQLTIKAGKMAGLDIGSKVAIYPAGTVDPEKAKKIAEGTIEKSENYFSTVKLNKQVTLTQTTEAWAFITERVYKIDPISIEIVSAKVNDPKKTASRGNTNVFSVEETKGLKVFLQNQPLIKFDNKPELQIVKGTERDSIKVAGNGYLFATVKNIRTDTVALKEKLQEYAQYKFLKELEVKDKNINIEVILVPVINGKIDTGKISSKIVNGVYEYTENDTLTVWIKNKGNKAAYVNILDLQPDGIINAVLPNKQYEVYARELKIEAGKEFIFPLNKFFITIAPPYGDEVFKIFASSTEIDLENIATTRGEGQRGNLTALEGLVKKSFGTRGGQVGNLSNADGTTATILFRIKKAE